MNSVYLIGRTTAEIDLRITQSGKSVAKFTLAVNRLKKEDGADFIQCQVWGKNAENMQRFVHKGQKVAVMGRIRTGSYEKNGVKHYTTDVVVSEVEFLERKQEHHAGGYSGGYQQTPQNSRELPPDYDYVDEETPF